MSISSSKTKDIQAQFINMNAKVKRTNPYSGQSEMLTLEEAKLYDQVKQDEIDEN